MIRRLLFCSVLVLLLIPTSAALACQACVEHDPCDDPYGMEIYGDPGGTWVNNPPCAVCDDPPPSGYIGSIYCMMWQDGTCYQGQAYCPNGSVTPLARPRYQVAAVRTVTPNAPAHRFAASAALSQTQIAQR